MKVVIYVSIFCMNQIYGNIHTDITTHVYPPGCRIVKKSDDTYI